MTEDLKTQEVIPPAEKADATLDSILDKVLSDEPAPEATEAPTAHESKARDEKGRFAPKGEKQDLTPETAAPEAPQPVEVTSTEETTPKAEPDAKALEGHFRGWAPEQRAKFDALPKEAQDVVLALKRETDSHYTRKLTDAAEFRKQAEPALKALSENADVFASQGLTAVDAVKNYANIERLLRFGKFDEKLGLIGKICQTYGIPFAPNAALESMDPERAKLYPMLHDRDAELARIRAENDRIQRQLNSTEQERLRSEIGTFQGATNADGTPKHPHFETVKAAMSGLLQAGKANSLEEAYTLAAKPIEDAIAAKTAALRQEAEASRLEAVERAKKAKPVKATPSIPGGRVTAGKGLDDVIGSALDGMGY